MIFVSSGRNYGKSKNNYLRAITQNAVVLGCHACEVMTIVIAFHGSGFRTFKEFYTLQVLPHWKKAFPNLVSYNRFVELMPWCLMLLCCFLNTCKGEVTGISFVDSTPIEVCHPYRSKSHKVFKDIAGWGKNSMGWHAASEACLVVVRRLSGRMPCVSSFT